MEASRPGTGDKVLILSTENTRFFLQSKIGQECIIQFDEKDFHPYQVSGCSAWLFESDVKIQLESLIVSADDSREENFKKAVSFKACEMSPLSDAEDEAELGHTMSAAEDNYFGHTMSDGEDEAEFGHSATEAEDSYFGGDMSATLAEFGVSEDQLIRADRSLNRTDTMKSSDLRGSKEEMERRRSVMAAAAEALVNEVCESPSAAAPSGLVENSEGCPCFAPNPFKKIKCKNCGCPWKEHLGVISEELLKGFLK